jgi:hypothetical protein
MKLDVKDYINLLLFIAVVILLFIIIVKIQGDGVQCTFNPLEYGANQLRELNNEDLMCSCTLFSELPSGTLFFNHNSTTYVPPERGIDLTDTEEFDLSGLVPGK